MADEKQKSALVRRHEQLKRWEDSDTNKAATMAKDKDRRVKFQDGCVFLAACSAGDTPEVRALLDRGGNPNTTNVDGLTALHQACIDDNIDMAKFLIAHGADINARDNEGWTPLHATASCGYLDIAKYLIDEGADIACTNSDGDLPIDIAEGADMEILIAHEMEKQNVDADAARNDEESRMLVDANNWLQTKSINEERHTRTGATALHVAASKGYIKVMITLLQAGADINSRDLDGWTPLHAAAHWAKEEACKLLVEHMCDMEAKTNAGLTVFEVADEEMLKLLQELKEKQQSMQAKDKKNELDDDIIAMRQQHSAYKRRSSVNRMNSEEKHVIAQEVKEHMPLISVRDENHTNAQVSSADDEDDDEAGKNTDVNADVTSGNGCKLPGGGGSEKTEKLPGLHTKQDCSLITANSKLSKEDGNTRNLNNICVTNSESSTGRIPAEDSPRSVEDARQTESKSEVSKKNGTATKDTVFAPTPANLTPASSGATAIGSKAAPSSSEVDRDNNTLPVPRSELREEEDQFNDTGLIGARPPPTAAAASGSHQRIESSATPESWRAGLRKTGSSSAVPETGGGSASGAVTPRVAPPSLPTVAADSGDKLIQRSASSSVLTGSSAADTSVSSVGAGAVSSTQATLRQRPSSYMNLTASGSAGSDAIERRHSAIDRVSAVAPSTPSAYIPYFRRKQIERENKEKEDKERASTAANETEASVSSPLPTLAEVSPSSQDRRSTRFELPKRDEETETIRKMRAKRARETRRSTQGVTQEDVKAAEATLKIAEKGTGVAGAAASASLAGCSVAVAPAAIEAESHLVSKEPWPSPAATPTSSSAVVKDDKPAPSLEEDSKAEDDSRRRPWQRDDGSRSSFRKARDVISSTTATPLLETQTSIVSISDDDKDKEDDDKNGRRASALKSRRNRRERRSTGISFNEENQEKNNEEKEKEATVENTDDYKASSNRYDTGRRLGSSSSDVAASSSGVSSLTSSSAPSSAPGSVLLRGDRSSSAYRQYLRGTSSVADSSSGSNNPEDYKKMYEDTKQENDRLKKDVQKLEQDVAEARSDLEKARQRTDSRVIDSGLEKRERRALERRISELEEELKNQDVLKQDNLRLKEENGALIRVISKLSK